MARSHKQKLYQPISNQLDSEMGLECYSPELASKRRQPWIFDTGEMLVFSTMPFLASGLLLAGHCISAFRLQRPSLASSISAVCNDVPSAKELAVFEDLSKHTLRDVKARFKHLEESLGKAPKIFIEQLEVFRAHLLEITTEIIKCPLDVAVLKEFKKDILGELVRLKVMAGKRLLAYFNYAWVSESVLFPLDEIKEVYGDTVYLRHRLPVETEYETFQEHIRILSTFVLDQSVKCPWEQFLEIYSGPAILQELKERIDTFQVPLNIDDNSSTVSKIHGRLCLLKATLEFAAQSLSNILLHIDLPPTEADLCGGWINNGELTCLKDEYFGLGVPMIFYQLRQYGRLRDPEAESAVETLENMRSSYCEYLKEFHNSSMEQWMHKYTFLFTLRSKLLSCLYQNRSLKEFISEVEAEMRKTPYGFKVQLGPNFKITKIRLCSPIVDRYFRYFPYFVALSLFILALAFIYEYRKRTLAY